jgi:hypothetical protein
MTTEEVVPPSGKTRRHPVASARINPEGSAAGRASCKAIQFNEKSDEYVELDKKY